MQLGSKKGSGKVVINTYTFKAHQNNIPIDSVSTLASMFFCFITIVP